MLEVIPAKGIDAGELRALVRAARDGVDLAMGAIGVAIARCVECGERMLLEKERVGHGAFEKWLVDEGIVGEEQEQITMRTAQRWMGLARFRRKSPADLEQCSSVTQAYRLAGLLPEPEQGNGASGQGGAGSYLEALKRTEATLASQLQARPLKAWPKEDLRLLQARLRPLAEVYEQAEALLEGAEPPR